MIVQIINRMEQDMQLLGLSTRTQETYLYRAKKIIEYFNKAVPILLLIRIKNIMKSNFFSN